MLLRAPTFTTFFNALKFLRTFILHIMQIRLLVKQSITLGKKTWGFRGGFKSQRTWATCHAWEPTTFDQSHRAAVFTEYHLLCADYIACLKLIGRIVVKSVLWRNLKVGVVALRGRFLVILVHTVESTSKVSLHAILYQQLALNRRLSLAFKIRNYEREWAKWTYLFLVLTHEAISEDYGNNFTFEFKQVDFK